MIGISIGIEQWNQIQWMIVCGDNTPIHGLISIPFFFVMNNSTLLQSGTILLWMGFVQSILKSQLHGIMIVILIHILGGVRIWNATTGKLLLISTSWDKTIKMWNAMTGEVLKSLADHTGSVVAASW
jgi:WD40 repeat protein